MAFACALGHTAALDQGDEGDHQERRPRDGRPPGAAARRGALQEGARAARESCGPDG